MDVGLGVRWPLSPFATALAAGAIFALCVAAWKRNFRAESDPKGRKRNLDPTKKGREENGEEDRENKKELLPVVKSRENLQFPLTARSAVGTHLLENIGAAIRRRRKECNFPNLTCSYQRSFSFGTDVSNLSTKLILDIHPYLSSYLQRFHYLKEIQLPVPDRHDIENCDVSINPEILKEKPITRAALSLELEKQLHRLLAPFESRGEVCNEGAVAECSVRSNAKENQSPCCEGACSDEQRISGFDYSRSTANSSALWDSGYCEKSLDESWSIPTVPDVRNENVCISPIVSTHELSSNSSSESQSISTVCGVISENVRVDTVFSMHEFDANSSNENVDYVLSSHEIATDLELNTQPNLVSEAIVESESVIADILSKILCEEANSIDKFSSRREMFQGANKANLTESTDLTEGSDLSETAEDFFISTCNRNKNGNHSTVLGSMESGDININQGKDNLNVERSKIKNDSSESDTTTQNEQDASACNKLLEKINPNLNQLEKEKDDNYPNTSILDESQASSLAVYIGSRDNANFSENVFISTCNRNKRQTNRTVFTNMESGDININEAADSFKLESFKINSDNSGDSITMQKQPRASAGSEHFEKPNPNSNLNQQETEKADNYPKTQAFLNENIKEAAENLNLESLKTTEGYSGADTTTEKDPEASIGNKQFEKINANQNQFHQIEAKKEDNYPKISALDEFQASLVSESLGSRDNNAIFSEHQNIQEQAESGGARAPRVDTRDTGGLEEFQERESAELPTAPERGESRVVEGDVTGKVASRDPGALAEGEEFEVRSQMDRKTQERSVAVESTVTTETSLRSNGDLTTAVSVSTTVSEEFVPLQSSEALFKSKTLKGDVEEELKTETESSADSLLSSPRADRLKGLLSRDEQRRKKFQQHAGDGGMEGEWDRLMRDVLASVSELERWERRRRDVSGPEDAEEHPHRHLQSDPSPTMEEEETSLSPTKGETPTKVKSLRFKLDPDIFDVPSDDSFYDDDQERGWRRQAKYKTFSSLDGGDEPVKLVSVQASVVPAGNKMVARPVEIDLRVRLTEERQSKRAHVSTSPSQAKRRSPVSDRGIGWCQELSPVTENVDWRESFTPVSPANKPMINGILKTPSPKADPPPVESPNPFRSENCVENGVVVNGTSPVIENKRVDRIKYNGLTWRPMERKPFSLPRKKFEPDPEAIERITGYKIALSKPPLPPPMSHKVIANSVVRNRAEIARKQYLDNKASLAAARVDNTKKFQQFVNQAQSDRARIVTSVPDLVAIERAVSEQWAKERASVSPRESPARESTPKADDSNFSRGSTPDDTWASYVQSCRRHLGRRSQSMTYLETDIDIIPILDEDDKCRSTSALDEPDEALPDPDDSDTDRSREDMDDSGRAKSEHELRIERSLRNLPLPDWYKQSEKLKMGFLLGSSAKEKKGWAAAKSLASSTSSLASCGLRRPVRSLRSSRENIPWSRSSASPDGPTLSLALAKAFREPYLGWRARTPTSSGVSSSPHASPPSWNATTDEETNGVSFDGEDAFGRTISSDDDRRTDEPLSFDDTGADAVTVSMDTNEPVKLPGGEDTCDDINNMSMDTCELFDASVAVPVDEDPSPQADTGDDIDNLSTDTTTEARKLDPKFKRYSYSQSIYHSELEVEEESRGDRKSKQEQREHSPSSPDHKVVWIESSFVGSRTTTSIVVLPQDNKTPGNSQERPASR